MSNRVSNYEELYGVGLLDDLHNYFPALLYEAESFRTVQDVLQYISLQTRRRFDLYSFGLSAYEEASGGAAASNTATNQFYQAPARSRTNPIPPPRSVTPPPTQNTTRPPSANRNAIPTTGLYRYVVDLGDERFDIGEHLLPNVNSTMSPTMLTTLLTGLVPRMQMNNQVDELTAVANLLLRMGGVGTRQNLEPVVVRPTLEQINHATEVMTSETEGDCAICQDTITNTQQCRRILHCAHVFHKDCIDPWFRQNVQCPICRYDIRDYRTGADQQAPASSGSSIPEEDYH